MQRLLTIPTSLTETKMAVIDNWTNSLLPRLLSPLSLSYRGLARLSLSEPLPLIAFIRASSVPLHPYVPWPYFSTSLSCTLSFLLSLPSYPITRANTSFFISLPSSPLTLPFPSSLYPPFPFPPSFHPFFPTECPPKTTD